jgi:magnesium-transporting ATPase (P-type)
MITAPNADPVRTAPTWHAVSADEAVKRLNTSSKMGLDTAEAWSRLQKYGPNLLPEGKKRGPLLRFLSQLNNILMYVLLAAGFVKLMLNLWVDAAIILGVVIINGFLGFIQEGKAEKALDSIRNMQSAEARTLRGGEARMIPAEELVPGDIVLLESGDKVPADLRLTDVKNLRTEEAALTGESVPVDKTTDAVRANATVGDRECIAFSGTMVVLGRATGVVVATGSETELGRINRLLATVSPLETPLLRQIKKFGYTITVVIAAVSVLVFAYGKWVKGMDFVELFQAVISIAVSAIPEGLPTLITITLAIGVQRMAQRNAIIRRLPAVETLGAVSRICSDKTGTLTLMEMMVVSAVTAEAEYQITGEGYAPEGEIKPEGGSKPEGGIKNDRRPPGKDRVLELMGRVSMLCNDAELFQQDGVWKVEGDPTEGALYPFATKLGMDRQAEQAAFPRIDEIPFESEHRFMATLHEDADNKQVLLVKGAPEVILEHCDRQQTRHGKAVQMDRKHFMQASDNLAGQGERVLALAWLENPGVQPGGLTPAKLPKNLVLLGLIGLLDPPRKEAIEAVKECHGGGVRVTMITGDHKITAAAIAKLLDIGDGKTAITGAEIEDMDTATLQERVRDVDVFARASPEHKLRLVKAIQANKQIVAMTGDGVNDAPALKKADIGVAMGIKGTEVTKEAAGMVLADDNFASITAAVREGRTVYNNIEKAMLFILPTNVAEALVIVVAILAGFTMPITAPQILWVNMVTSVALALVISFEPHELEVMRRPPRAIDRPILTGFGIWRVIFVGLALLAYTLGAFFWMKSQGASDPLARTVAVNAIVIGQVFYLLNSRYLLDSSLSIRGHLGNRYLPLGIGAAVILQLLFTYAPPLQRLFDNQAIPLHVWPRLFLGGLVFFLVVEAEKLIIRSSGSLRRTVVAVEAGASTSRAATQRAIGATY